MEKCQVLLVCLLPLLCEGLQRVLQQLDEVVVVCRPAAEALHSDQEPFQPDIVLVAGEEENDVSTHLIANLLNHFADVPIVWVGLEANVLRLYTSHVLPASSASLIEAIRGRSLHVAASAHSPASSGGNDDAT